MPTFTIEVHDAAVKAALKALAERAGNTGPVLGAMGEDIIARTKARFDSSTAPDGAPRKPKKKQDSRKTLVGPTGNLRRQIVRQVAGSTLTVAAHSITIPARPFMPVRADRSLYPAEQRLIVDQINAWLAGR